MTGVRPFFFDGGMIVLHSMTGFGTAACTSHGFTLEWQLKSVNHRFLDLSLRMPEGCGALEIQATKRLKAHFQRGRLEATLSVQSHQTEGATMALNEPLLREVLALEGVLLARSDGERAPLSIGTLLSWPGIVKGEESVGGGDRADPSFQEVALTLLDEAAEKLAQMRQTEGESLGQFVREQLDGLGRLATDVAQQIPRIQHTMEERLRSRLQVLTDTIVDESRLAQEQIYLLNRLDVSEELDRLRIHLGEIDRVLNQDHPVGRRLDFLCQELNREANTLCSKSQDGELTLLGVELKVGIEKLREQIQNLE